MAPSPYPDDADPLPAEAVAGGSNLHPLTAAALVGGAIAATAGVYLGSRALARRNGASDGKPVNSVMATAITACDVAGPKQAPEVEPAASPIIAAS